MIVSCAAFAQDNPNDLKFSGTGLTYNGVLELEGNRLLSYEKCKSQDHNKVDIDLDLDPTISINIVSGWVEIRYYLYRASNNQLVKSLTQNLYNLGNLVYTVDAAMIEQYCHMDITPTVRDGFYMRVEVVEGNCVGSWCWLTNAPNAWNLNRGTYTTNPSSIDINDAVPRFTLSSQYGTDAGGTPLTCQSNITINGASTSCETKYLIEVIETDATWDFNINGTNYAGAWFNGQVPTIWHLQHIAQYYGNPSNGDVVNGPPPTQYNGWTMTDRTLSNGNNNRYLVKLSVMDDTWTSKQMLIEVNSNCKAGKTDVNMDDFISSLDPMTPDEVAQVQSELKAAGVDFKSLKQLALESPGLGEVECTVYPNPANSTITFEFNDEVQLESATFVSASGQKFALNVQEKQGAVYEFNVSEVNPGFYVVFIETNNGYISKKVQIVD